MSALCPVSMSVHVQLQAHLGSRVVLVLYVDETPLRAMIQVCVYDPVGRAAMEG